MYSYQFMSQSVGRALCDWVKWSLFGVGSGEHLYRCAGPRDRVGRFRIECGAVMQSGERGGVLGFILGKRDVIGISVYRCMSVVPGRGWWSRLVIPKGYETRDPPSTIIVELICNINGAVL
jgi:hypothetical protein